MSDADVLEDLIAKLREMQDQLSMAEVEVAWQGLVASRIRYVSILATYVRHGLQEQIQAANGGSYRNSEARPKAAG